MAARSPQTRMTDAMAQQDYSSPSYFPFQFPASPGINTSYPSLRPRDGGGTLFPIYQSPIWDDVIQMPAGGWRRSQPPAPPGTDPVSPAASATQSRRRYVPAAASVAAIWGSTRDSVLPDGSPVPVDPMRMLTGQLVPQYNAAGIPIPGQIPMALLYAAPQLPINNAIWTPAPVGLPVLKPVQ